MSEGVTWNWAQNSAQARSLREALKQAANWREANRARFDAIEQAAGYIPEARR